MNVKVSTFQQENMSNMLSPEAKEFVPRQQGGSGDTTPGPCTTPEPSVDLVTGQPLNGLPSYITTCYPFVSTADPRLTGGRPRGRGKFGPQMYMTQQFSPMHSGMPRNRFPHPSKSYIPGSSWDPNTMADFYHNFGHNGMPFDGGTYQNGFVRPGMPQMPTGDPKALLSPTHGFPGPYGDMYIDSTHLLNGYTDPLKQKWINKQKLNNRKEEDFTLSKTDSTKICFKNSSIQTDLPPHIADLTLDELPNSLFKPSQNAILPHDPHLTNSVTLEQGQGETSRGHLNHLSKHKRNNGTNPPYDFSTVNNSTSMTHLNNNCEDVTGGNSQSGMGLLGAFPSLSRSGSQLLYSDRVNSMQNLDSSVPYSVCETNAISSQRHSYASIAQKAPSQSKFNMVARQPEISSVAIVTSDQKTCDSSNSHEENSRRVPKIGNKSRYSNVNINVAEIMEDLERADAAAQSGSSSVKVTLASGSSSSAYQPVTMVTQTSQSEKSKFSYSSAVQQGSSSRSSSNNIQRSVSGVDINSVKPLVTGGLNSSVVHGQQVVKPVQTSVVSDLHDLLVKSQIQVQGQSDNNNNEGEVKKKRRRRRRRKRKSGDVEGENDDGNSGANEEITLHFEDEEEFPDLMGVATGVDEGKISSLNNAASVSYSEILKNNNTQVQSTLSSQDESCAQNNTGASQEKESRSSRKRRKRREVANKAADAEMAEIGLEQHMLELKMKQKLPLAAKKSVSPVRSSVSPVRNPASQGVWKLTPSSPTTQPSSSGKKVSLLLPGIVAPEPGHNSTPHTPNTTVKQPGILKTSQPSITSTTSNASSGGKKSKQPITYDIAALIDASLESKKGAPQPKQDVRPVVIKKDDLKPLNVLDSSAPTIKRGKERETPKNKKPSPLKKVILKEREEKKRLRMLDEDEVNAGLEIGMPVSAFPNSPISAPVGIGVVSGGESDLSQDATSFRGSTEVGLGTPASAELSPISQPSPSCISPMSPGASPLSSGVNSPVTGTIQQTVKLKIHSRRFREYCNQVLDKEIDSHVTALLQDLVRFQDKQYHKDPIKAKSKRRFVLGLREVTKHLKLRKIKCVVISPNLEKIQSKGGLDDALNSILELCNEQKVPFIFALGRRALGRACAKLVPVSVVGIFNYEGSEENFRSVVQLTEKAREQYREMIVQIEKEIAEYPPRVSIPGVPHIFAHMGHSRTPSGCSVISFTSSILSEPISENYPHSEPETDNRGYEIERDVDDENDDPHNDDDDDDDIDDDDREMTNDDAYEADDESGGRKIKKKVSKEELRVISVKMDTVSGNSYLINSGDNLVITSNVSDTVQRRPGILKNSAARLRNNRKLENEVTKAESENVVEDVAITTGESVISSQNNPKLGFSSSDRSVPDCKGTMILSSHYEKDAADFSGMDINANVNNVNDDLENSDQDELEEFETCEENSEDGDDIKPLRSFIDSFHHFDINEILSQHSTKTVENSEDVLSTHSSKTTHSSRTLGDGSALTGDRPCKSKLELKNLENANNVALLKGKTKVDKENRTLSWVKEAQSLHFGEQGEPSKDVDETGVKIERLDVVA